MSPAQQAGNTGTIDSTNFGEQLGLRQKDIVRAANWFGDTRRCGAISQEARAPAGAWNTLNRIDTRGSTGHADPNWQVNSGPFKNDGRSGTTILPKNNSSNNPITYREYDVSPFVTGRDRGRERLVVGSNGSAFFTNDHYCNWVQMR